MISEKILIKALYKIVSQQEIKVLIVEDNRSLIDIIIENLKSYFKDIKIEVTNSVRIALTKIDNNFFDMIICDLSLVDKDLDGCSVIEKGNEQHAFTVLHTGSGECRSILPSFVLNKPIEDEEFEKMIEKFKAKKWVD